jgi:RNA polymerase sigma factor (sigma-70 family)
LQALFHAGSLTGITDGQLLERFVLRDGEPSEAAFAALVDRHGPLVWRTCRAVLRDEHQAADAFQAAFLVLVRKAGSLWVRDSIAPWLHRVAFRAANQARREARRRRETERRAAELRANWTEGEMTDDLADMLHREIDRLPDRHRIVVVLCDLEGRSHEEAARHLRCPVGTVKSRLARARERLREVLARRGIVPAVLASGIDRPPEGLVASTVRGSVLFASDPARASAVVSTSAAALEEGVRKTMIRVRLQVAILAALAVTGLLVPAWLAVARQAADDRAKTKVRPVGKEAGVSAVDLRGNWIVRVSGDDALALVGIEGPPGQQRVRFLSLGFPNAFDFARSTLDHVRIDERTVRFTLQLFRIQTKDIRPVEIVAHRLGDEARPTSLRGAWIEERSRARTRGMVAPVALERTDRAELDLKEAGAASPGWEEFRRGVQSKDPAEQKDLLEGIIAKYGDTPVAQLAAQTLAIIRADAGALNEEVRGLIDRAARIGSRHCREIEIGTIGLIVDNVTGAEGRDELVLEYARKAVAMLHPEDSAALQVPTIKYLVAALRKSRTIDEAKAAAEVRVLEHRIATLGGRADHGRAPAVPWARSFTAASVKARADGKLVMAVFYTEGSRWWEHLDAEVFPGPDVAEAIRPFVPVQVDAEGGDGRPLAEKYRAHVGMIDPIILFLDPANVAEGDGVVARIPGMIPAGTLVEGLQSVARLPRNIGPLVRKAHPDDGDAMRQLATALAMRGRVQDAAALIDRAWGPAADRGFDRWAAVYNTLGIELMMRLRWREALDWFNKAAGVAKRPIDVYNAHLGAGFAALLQNRGDLAAREFGAAARADGVASGDRDFARQLAGNPAKMLDGPAGKPSTEEKPSSAAK